MDTLDDLTPDQVDASDSAWLSAQVLGLTDEKLMLKVSEWAEVSRYIPPELTTRPGFWDNDYTPYLREIMDCFSESDPTQKVAFVKPVQIGGTTGVLENVMGYKIDHAPSAMIFVSADKGLAETAVELRVDRMIDSCGLRGKIGPPDKRSRKSGDTASKKTFPGGFLLALGANNPGKLRMISAPVILLDEVDGMPHALGEEGDPIKLAENRTKAFQGRRKIGYVSTPLVLQTSRIWALFLRGDQRHYNVPCVHCGEFQVLVWHGVKDDGTKYGIEFDVDDEGRLNEETVRYRCEHCGEAMYDHDKVIFLRQGEWVPTAKPQEANFRSYHLNALYSPPAMCSWSTLVLEWLEAWDIKRQRVRDIEKYKTFRNTVQGLPYEERGEAPSYERVISHRRGIYKANQIPNKAAIEESGGPVHFLTCAVDVHGKRLDVEVVAWCNEGRTYSVCWRSIEGDTEDLHSKASPWRKLSDLVEDETWEADDGRKYRVAITLVDAGYRTDIVYQWCNLYSVGVYPVQGRQSPPKNAAMREFQEYESRLGTEAFNVNVTLYKDRIAAWLRNPTSSGEALPPGYPSYPEDYGDDFFKQYQAEYKAKEVSRKTGATLGYFWVKIPNTENHAWDCRVYGTAAADILIYSICVNDFELERIDYPQFYRWCMEENPFVLDEG